MTSEEKERLIASIRDEVTSYVSNWMKTNWPDFGTEWTNALKLLNQEMTEAKYILKNMKKDWERTFINHNEDFKREINQFLSKDHPVFGQIEKIRIDLQEFSDKKNNILNEFKYDIKELEEKHKNYDQAISMISKSSSLFQDFYEMKDELRSISKKHDCFREALRNMLNDNPAINPATPIEELNFSDRTENILKNANISTAEQLFEMPLELIKRFRNMGQKSIAEIKNFRKEYEG